MERDEKPWFDHEIKVAMTKRRCAERIWRANRDTEDATALRKNFTFWRNVVVNLIKKKYLYYKNTIENCGHDAKRLYNKLNFLLGKQKGDSFPDGNWDSLVNDFGEFFHSKISSIK